MYKNFSVSSFLVIAYLGTLITFADAWFPYSAMGLAAFLLLVTGIAVTRSRAQNWTENKTQP